MLASNARACSANLCSTSTSYRVATTWLTEVKSRRPLVAAYPMRAQTMPKRAPKATVDRTANVSPWPNN